MVGSIGDDGSTVRVDEVEGLEYPVEGSQMLLVDGGRNS